MDYITYNTTLKACGDEYKKIVFWNRFLRNPAELILTLLPAVISVICMCMQFFNIYCIFFYTASFAYPIYIFAIQFKTTVNYHLKHRDPLESAPCSVTLTNTGIIAEIPEHDVINTYSWEDFTTAYNKFGYYMFFNGSKMIVMLRQADMSDEQQKTAPEFIKSCINMNVCKVLF